MSDKSFNFESLTVYSRSLHFSFQIYQITQKWPREHLFGITDQIRRAAISIPLNIVEGSSRTKKDFRHFLIIARGSCFECIPLMKLTLDLNLITISEEQTYYNELMEISQMLSAFRRSLDR